MRRLTDTDGLSDVQRDILRTVRDFVDDQVLPVATELDHSDAYPDKIVERLKELGVFGLTISERYGGLGESLLTYALVVEELSRGWMSISGIINTHFMVAYLIAAHGTDEQREYFLPRMATGEVRGALSMSEPGLGSDVAAIRTAARPAGDGYLISGQKMWLTNGSTASLVVLLARTGDDAERPHRGLTAFLVEKDPGYGETRPGLTVPGKIHKMGYKGVDTTELILDECRVPASRVLGGADQAGRGFYQLMDGIEVGRVNVAARARPADRLSQRLATVTHTPRETRLAAARPNTPSPDPITTFVNRAATFSCSSTSSSSRSAPCGPDLTRYRACGQPSAAFSRARWFAAITTWSSAPNARRATYRPCTSVTWPRLGMAAPARFSMSTTCSVRAGNRGLGGLWRRTADWRSRPIPAVEGTARHLLRSPRHG